MKIELQISNCDSAHLTDRIWNEVLKTIEHSFGMPIAGTFSRSAVQAVFFSKGFEGVAVVSRFTGVHYLDKLAVLESHRKLGLGSAVLSAVFEQFPALVWRARYNNPYVSFYYRHCHGLIKTDLWIVFWKTYTLNDVTGVVPFVLEKPADF